jgi:large subunit ribosomal protein L22
MAEQKKDTEKKDTDKKQRGASGAGKGGERSKGGSRQTTAGKGAAKPAESKSAAKASGEKKADKPATSPAKAKAAAKTEGSGAKAATKAKPKPKEVESEAPVVRARASYVRVAPRKARLLADQVRGLPLEDARTLLRFSPRSAARDIVKLIDSAAANAENNHELIADELRIVDIRVDEGPTLRRYRPRALGRATRINKRTSHIQVALTPEED